MIKQDEIVLCIVTKIEGTTVFVNIDEYNLPGTIVFSEIAAGRIRNIREFVVPNKKIVCKVLKNVQGNIELTFRRVTASERDATIEKYKQEKTFKTMLKNVTKDADSILIKIKEVMSIQEFLMQVKENPKLISNFFNKEESEKLKKMLSEKKERAKEAKKIFSLKSESEFGILDLKDILKTKEANISYLGSSKFSISCIGKNFKEANQKCQIILQEIEKKAKSKKAIFEIK